MFPSGQWGQTVNLLLFSFGGSNPPAPTKNSSIRTGYWSFCFVITFPEARRVDSNSIDPPNSPAGKKPLRGFLDARLAQSTRAHKKPASVEIRWRALAWSCRRGKHCKRNGFV